MPEKKLFMYCLSFKADNSFPVWCWRGGAGVGGRGSGFAVSLYQFIYFERLTHSRHNLSEKNTCLYIDLNYMTLFVRLAVLCVPKFSFDFYYQW